MWAQSVLHCSTARGRVTFQPVLFPDPHNSATFCCFWGTKMRNVFYLFILCCFDHTVANSIILHFQFWTESHVKFSPKGSYLATCHKQGIALWGGPEFSKVGRFNHPNVTYFQFSPCERYVWYLSTSSTCHTSTNYFTSLVLFMTS